MYIYCLILTVYIPMGESSSNYVPSNENKTKTETRNSKKKKLKLCNMDR